LNISVQLPSVKLPYGKLTSTEGDLNGKITICFLVKHTVNIADVCLGWLNQDTNTWQCVDSRLQKSESNYCGNTMKTGVHGIIDNVILQRVRSPSPLPTPNFLFTSLREIIPLDSYELYYSAISIPDYIFSFSVPNPVVPHFNTVVLRDDDDDDDDGDDQYRNSGLMLCGSFTLALILLAVFF